jgi:hypothetical protein
LLFELLQEAAAERDAAQERVDRLEKPAKRLEEAVAAQSVSALARQYGGLNNAAAALKFPNVSTRQSAIGLLRSLTLCREQGAAALC